MPQKLEVKNHPIPVYIPGENGEVKIEVGSATLRKGTIVIELKENIASVALQRLLARELLFGLAVILQEPGYDEAAKEYIEERMEEKRAAAKEAEEASPDEGATDS